MATKQQKKMKKARKMRERQINVFKGMLFLLGMALCLALFPKAHAAVTIVTARPAITISRPAVTPAAPQVSVPSTPPVRVSSPPVAPVRASSSGYSRSMNGSSAAPSSSLPIPLYVPIFLHGSGASASEATEVATPLLTKCTPKEFEQAKLW